MSKGTLKNRASFFNELHIVKSNQQFIIDVQTALVQIRGPCINHMIDDEQFSMKDLWFVFVNFNSRAEKASI